METPALIALKQPISAAYINDTRGVRGVGALKTLLHPKLITRAARSLQDVSGSASAVLVERQRRLLPDDHCSVLKLHSDRISLDE